MTVTLDAGRLFRFRATLSWEADRRTHKTRALETFQERVSDDLDFTIQSRRKNNKYDRSEMVPFTYHSRFVA